MPTIMPTVPPVLNPENKTYVYMLTYGETKHGRISSTEKTPPPPPPTHTQASFPPKV